MKRTQIEPIRFVVSIEEHEEGIKLPVNQYKLVSKESVKKYCFGYYKLFQLDGTSRNLLDWLVDNMSAENIVENNVHKRQKFIDLAKKDAKIIYLDQTVRKAFQKLTRGGILIPIRKGLFQINPELYFKGDERMRRKILRAIYEKHKFDDLSIADT